MKKCMLLVGLIFIIFFISVNAEYIPFKIKLNAFERIVAISLFPKETTYANWKVINDIKNQLSFNEEEMVKLEIQTLENGGVTAKWDAIPEKEIIFGEVTEKMIVDALKKLDSEGKITNDHLSLYEKFIVRGSNVL